jgi:hypothetical protein
VAASVRLFRWLELQDSFTNGAVHALVMRHRDPISTYDYDLGCVNGMFFGEHALGNALSVRVLR